MKHKLYIFLILTMFISYGVNVANNDKRPTNQETDIAAFKAKVADMVKR